MLSLHKWKFLFLIIFAFLIFARKAQKNPIPSFSDSTKSWLNIIPQDLSNAIQNTEEDNINQVISVLQSNIQQWSFVEAQLLEPNIHLGMPEIYIPLKHLTATLEVLGGIFFMKNDYLEAKNIFERACPLLELIPTSNLDMSEGVYLEKESVFLDLELSPKLNNNHKNYAEGCFLLLRNVYKKLYGSKLLSSTSNDDDEFLPITKQSPGGNSRHSSSHTKQSKSQLEDSEDGDDSFRSEVWETNEEEVDRHPSSASRTSPPLPIDPIEDEQMNVYIDKKIAKLRSPFKHLRSEFFDHQEDNQEDDDVNDEDENENDDEDDLEDTDFQEFIESSRSLDTGEHDKTSEGDNPTSLPSSSNKVPVVQLSTSSNKALPKQTIQQQVKKQSTNMNSNLFHEFDSVFKDQLRNHIKDSDEHYKFLMSLDSRFQDVAADLEVILRKFVQEENVKQTVYNGALRYLDDFDTNFPNMEDNKYAACLVLGSTLLEVLNEVIINGYDFIDEELKDLRHHLSLDAGKGEIMWIANNAPRKTLEFNVQFFAYIFKTKPWDQRSRLLTLCALKLLHDLGPYVDIPFIIGFSFMLFDNEQEFSSDNQNEILKEAINTRDAMRLRRQGKVNDVNALPSSNGQNKAENKDIPEFVLEEQVSPLVGFAASLRSSVPTLRPNDDWSMHLFILFMLITACVMYVAYQESLKKKLRQRGIRTNKKNETINGLFRPFISSDANDFSANDGPQESLATMLLNLAQKPLSTFKQSLDWSFTSTANMIPTSTATSNKEEKSLNKKQSISLSTDFNISNNSSNKKQSSSAYSSNKNLSSPKNQPLLWDSFNQFFKPSDSEAHPTKPSFSQQPVPTPVVTPIIPSQHANNPISIIPNLPPSNKEEVKSTLDTIVESDGSEKTTDEKFPSPVLPVNNHHRQFDIHKDSIEKERETKIISNSVSSESVLESEEESDDDLYFVTKKTIAPATTTITTPDWSNDLIDLTMIDDSDWKEARKKPTKKPTPEANTTTVNPNPKSHAHNNSHGHGHPSAPHHTSTTHNPSHSEKPKGSKAHSKATKGNPAANNTNNTEILPYVPHPQTRKPSQSSPQTSSLPHPEENSTSNSSTIVTPAWNKMNRATDKSSTSYKHILKPDGQNIKTVNSHSTHSKSPSLPPLAPSLMKPGLEHNDDDSPPPLTKQTSKDSNPTPSSVASNSNAFSTLPDPFASTPMDDPFSNYNLNESLSLPQSMQFPAYSTSNVLDMAQPSIPPASNQQTPLNLLKSPPGLHRDMKPVVPTNSFGMMSNSNGLTHPTTSTASNTNNNLGPSYRYSEYGTLNPRSLNTLNVSTNQQPTQPSILSPYETISNSIYQNLLGDEDDGNFLNNMLDDILLHPSTPPLEQYKKSQGSSFGQMTPSNPMLLSDLNHPGSASTNQFFNHPAFAPSDLSPLAPEFLPNFLPNNNSNYSGMDFGLGSQGLGLFPDTWSLFHDTPSSSSNPNSSSKNKRNN